MAMAMGMGRRNLARKVEEASRRWMSTSEWWKNVEPAPKDPILGVTEAFLADPNPNKVNVGVGAYRDDQGKPVVLQCVRDAERLIAGKEFMEYLPMGGSVKMVEESLKLAYGENADVLKDKRVAAVQALSGTGACRLFAEFQKRFRPESQIYIPVPTWANILCDDAKQAVAVKSQLQQIARPMYSNPPVHGALLVSTILSDPDLKALWHKEVKRKSELETMEGTGKGREEELTCSVCLEQVNEGELIRSLPCLHQIREWKGWA